MHTVSVPFAIVTGTGAGLLALLSWEVFRESPFGTAVAMVAVVMSGTTIYHTVLLVVGTESTTLRILRGSVYTLLAVSIWLVVYRHRAIQRGATFD